MMKKNILLVDEDILVLKALRRSLHKFKDQWTVYYAQSPRAALEQLDQGTVDVLITEVRLTAADGELFLRLFLKRYPRAARIVLNSPFYGLPMPVTEPQKAVALVGLDEDSFIASLLHDVAKIIIASNFSKEFREIRRCSLPEGVPDWNAYIHIDQTTLVYFANAIEKTSATGSANRLADLDLEDIAHLQLRESVAKWQSKIMSMA